MKIAVLSGRPKDGTLLPRKEQHVWHELCRILKEDMDRMEFHGATFLIPIYSKFDLQVLFHAEKMNIPVEYYVPSEDWGKTSLPIHQIKLVERMEEKRVVVPGGSNARIKKMIADADAVYILPGTHGFSSFIPLLKGKKIIPFPFRQMRYQTEDEAIAWHEEVSRKTKLHVSLKKIKEKQNEQMDMEIDSFLNGSPKELTPSDIDELFDNYNASNFDDFLNNPFSLY